VLHFAEICLLINGLRGVLTMLQPCCISEKRIESKALRGVLNAAVVLHLRNAAGDKE
jgi:hypothetical protein